MACHGGSAAKALPCCCAQTDRATRVVSQKSCRRPRGGAMPEAPLRRILCHPGCCEGSRQTIRRVGVGQAPLGSLHGGCSAVQQAAERVTSTTTLAQPTTRTAIQPVSCSLNTFIEQQGALGLVPGLLLAWHLHAPHGSARTEAARVTSRTKLDRKAFVLQSDHVSPLARGASCVQEQTA